MNDYRQYCHVGNTAPHCRLGLFQDSDVAADLEVSKSTSLEIYMYFKKSKNLFHGSAESEIISRDAGLRMNGVFALDFWDVVIGM